jgi:hypothetical protein
MAIAARALQAAAKQGAAQHKAELQQQADREIARASRTHVARVRVTTEIAPVNLEEQQDVPTLNAAKMLDHIEHVLNYWARFENPHHATLIALWIASTWMTDGDHDHPTLLFDAHPRLFMIADKGSGKTRVMKLVRSMARNSTGIAKPPYTGPGVRNALAAGKTVLLDEFDREVGKGMAHLDVQGQVSAYEAETESLNGVGGVNEPPIFGPMMLAAKPRILTGTNEFIEDLFERSFIIPIKKYALQNDPIPDLDEDFNKVVRPLGKVLEIWAEAIRPGTDDEGNLIKLRPIHTVPVKLTARMREISSSLLAVADRAVDPDVMAATGSDTRWAVKGRTAVQNVLLGHGDNGAELIAELDSRFKELGIS